MKNRNFYGYPLTEQEAKEIKGGYIFSYSEHGLRCPVCGEWIEIATYTYYLICPKCGGNITLEDKE